MNEYEALLGSVVCHWHPPASEQEVSLWEARWGIRLPASFRTLITHFGNGGTCGPTRILALSEGEDLALEQAEDNTPEVKAEYAARGARVPARSSWAPASPFPVTADEAKSPDIGSEGVLLLCPADGTLPLVEGGCGYGVVLIVAGELAGQVWRMTTDEGGRYWPDASSLEEYLHKEGTLIRWS